MDTNVQRSTQFGTHGGVYSNDHMINKETERTNVLTLKHSNPTKPNRAYPIPDIIYFILFHFVSQSYDNIDFFLFKVGSCVFPTGRSKTLEVFF